MLLKTGHIKQSKREAIGIMSPFRRSARLSANPPSWSLDDAQSGFSCTTFFLVLLLMFLALSSQSATATNYYLSPTGSDTSPGTSQTAPWKTFAHAIPSLNPGDTLNLLNGTYSLSNGTGLPTINCSSESRNGTSAAPITIQAVNERQAFISGDGSRDTLLMANCSYWNVVGLRLQSADLNVGDTSKGNVVQVNSSSHITLRRNIMAQNNRFGNTDIILLYNGTNHCLIEENEIYSFHRWGILLYTSSNNEVRRNYVNGRGYGNISGGYPNGGTVFGIGAYNGSDSNTFENNIAENILGAGFNVEDTASNNTFLGNISGPNLTYATRIGPHSGDAQPTGNSFVNHVALTPSSIGFWSRSSKSSYNHVSVFGNSSPSAGFLSDTDSCCSFSSYQFSVTNSLATGITSGTAFKIVNLSGNTFNFDHNSSFNNALTLGVGLTSTNQLSADPGLGSCYLWAPASSRLKGAAADGGDIGANVVFQYAGGNLTSVPLWDSTTGAPVFRGATVAGLNDVAGASLFDIPNRLNINQNGCSLSGGGNQASAPAAPTGLTAMVQ
jgi:parallel beta-helix repeat protein